MSPVTDRYADHYAASRQNRAVSFVLALAINLLLLVTLIAMGSFEAPPGSRGSQLVAITLRGEQAEQRERSAARARHAPVSTPQTATRQQRAPRIELPSQNKLQMPEGFIQLSRTDLAAADIGKMRSASATGAGGSEAASGGGGSGAGEGPGGARLYNAEWYREPTHAELAGYVPAGRDPGDWAMIVCRTTTAYHVEDCRELGESPAGTGMARALRQAAWQFLVRPPRTDGKPLIGAWVRIRYDFIKGKREDVPG
ncbi:MAG: hypothetical protein FP826_02810 [Sphingomonadales bacterium]|nr:hypothetical protein [Sphingomonadales bacterium]MBU3993326.1 hypothetical protein [Alphaproteobacteria bacterium]